MVPPSRPRLALCLFPWCCVTFQLHVAILFLSRVLRRFPVPSVACSHFCCMWCALLQFSLTSPSYSQCKSRRTIWRRPLILACKFLHRAKRDGCTKVHSFLIH
ncbi:hypothetical protein B0H10DRAFT_2113920, partial [Mycena sp. CBHHK59/15]